MEVFPFLPSWGVMRLRELRKICCMFVERGCVGVNIFDKWSAMETLGSISSLHNQRSRSVQ